MMDWKAIFGRYNNFDKLLERKIKFVILLGSGSPVSGVRGSGRRQNDKFLVRLFFILITFACTNSLLSQDIHCLTLPAITVDGKPDEWPQPFRYYEGTTKLQFAYANNTAYLYACIKVTDAATQLRLFNAGLNICVDPKGKKKETIILSFPTKPEGESGEGGGGQRHHRSEQGSGLDDEMHKTDLLRLKHHAKTQQLTIRIKGFAGVPEQVLPLENAYHITAAFDWDSLDILTIEYRLPLALIFGHSFGVGDTLKPIGVGFVEPAPEVHHTSSNGGVQEGEQGAGDVSNSNSGMNRGGMGGGGMGGMGGGGMGGGMGGGGMRGGGGHGGGGHMQEADPSTQEQKVWSKVFLRWI